jgi:hypothetical protein
MTKQDGGWERTLALVIGSAIGGAVAFAACLAAFIVYFSSGTSSFTFGGSGKVIHGVPPIQGSEKFLGTMGSFNTEFDHKNANTVLESGPGQIVGTITVDGKPRSGVRIRLALNGAAMSQWGESAQDGRYSISVPYGDYRVDGYDFDHTILNGALGGKTDSPRNNFHGVNRFTVAEGKPGKGIDLDYVDPAVLTGPMGDVPASGPIVLAWKVYPNAAAYRVALTEFKRPGDYRSQRSVFEWSDRPVVNATSLDLSARGTALQKGFYYRADIEALDSSKEVISSSGNRFGNTDFHVAE